MRIVETISIIIGLMLVAGGIGFLMGDGVPIVIHLEANEKASVIASEVAKCNVSVQAEATSSVKNCKENLATANSRILTLEKNREATWSFVNGNSTAISAVNKSLIDMNRTINKLIVDMNADMIDLNKTIVKEC